jgi:threo-3-hydroxy-L-aspartate ammonia-lyase
MTLVLDDFYDACTRLEAYINQTPLVRARFLEKNGQGPVYLKCENLQVTGSFKARGAFFSLLALTDEEKKRGVVTRSSGNFARAVGYAGKILNIPTTIVMPESAPEIKKRETKALADRVFIHGTTHAEGESLVEELSRSEGLVALSPYDHLQVMIGQGSAGIEVIREIPDLASFLCPVGGGGLLGGCATAIKLSIPNARIVAVEPEEAADFKRSMDLGERTALSTTLNTIADGLRAPVVGDIPWPYLQRHVDTVITVSEKSIKWAVSVVLKELGMVLEPSAAVSVAALLEGRRFSKGVAVCLISGKNVDEESFRNWVREVRAEEA